MIKFPLKDNAYMAMVRAPILLNTYNALGEYYLWFRLDRRVTKAIGTKYRPNRRAIQIDLTYLCGLTCPCCCRSCTQAPEKEYITLSQIEKFIQESIRAGRNWRQIDLMGGEPTLHPDFMKILDMVRSYKNEHSPKTRVCILTGVTPQKIVKTFGKIPKDVEVISKPMAVRHFEKDDWYGFNTAPLDLPRLSRMEFSNGCWVPQTCGIGLNKYGYYCCGNGAGIDRIFGFNIGRKSLPRLDDDLIDQMRILCKYCGSFHRNFKRIDIGITNKFKFSKAWDEAYRKYRQQKPPLTLYR